MISLQEIFENLLALLNFKITTEVLFHLFNLAIIKLESERFAFLIKKMLNGIV